MQLSTCSSETVNLRKNEGQAKLGGTIVCVSGAILMVVFRGPTLLGFRENRFAAESDMSAKGQPEPPGWLMSNILELGIDNWHLGVICLIGNCICTATYISIQVMDINLGTRNFILAKPVKVKDISFILTDRDNL